MLVRFPNFLPTSVCVQMTVVKIFLLHTGRIAGFLRQGFPVIRVKTGKPAEFFSLALVLHLDFRDSFLWA